MRGTRFLIMLVFAAAAGTSLLHAAEVTAMTETPEQIAPPPTSNEEKSDLWLVELGGFDNFLTGSYGHWSGGQGKIMFRGLKHFAPIFGFAHQERDYGSQNTFGLDSYILVNKWFYAIAGGGYSPEGSAELWPKWRWGATGLFSIPKPAGLVATLGYSDIHGSPGTYGRVVSAGAMYYRGKAILSGNVSFNRTHPGGISSKSAGIALQYGAEKHYWIGGGFNGGRIAYQMFAVQPLPVEWKTFGPNFFYQKWLTRRVGFILKYDYQDEVHAFQRHGVAGSIFFEFR